MNKIQNQSVLDETLKKIGRNVLTFQRMEAMLKFLISHSKLQGTVSEVKSNHEKAVDAVSMQTMGNLVKNFVASVYSEPNLEQEPPVDNEQAWMSFTFTIETDEASIEQRKAALSAIVQERNALIHQMLGQFDHKSVESCRQLNDVLDKQSERMRPEFEALRTLVMTLLDGRKQAVAAMERELRGEAITPIDK